MDAILTFPLCFATAEDFARWRGSFEAKRVAHCRDCTPSFQLRMKKLNRCEHPETMFTFEEDGVVGLCA